MSKNTIKDFKYVVKLGRTANSFYDADSSGCNLFRSNPYYAFNHEPTLAILNGVRGGRLIDVKGNIVKESAVNANDHIKIEEIKKTYEAQITKLTKELGDANAEIIRLTEALESEADNVAEEKTAKPTKGKAKSKASDEE